MSKHSEFLDDITRQLEASLRPYIGEYNSAETQARVAHTLTNFLSFKIPRGYSMTTTNDPVNPDILHVELRFQQPINPGEINITYTLNE